MTPTPKQQDQTSERLICQECYYRTKTPGEYHPYWYCVLAKAGQLDIAKEAIAQDKQAAVLAGKLEAAAHIKEICPVTEGASVERLHHRIDTYLGTLQTAQQKLENGK